MMKRTSLALFLPILLSSLLAAPVSHAEKDLDRIVAVVNTEVITQQELAEQMELARQQRQAEHKPVPSDPLFREQVLNQMVDNALQRQFAQHKGLQIDDAALDKAIEDIARRNHITVMELRDRLEQENLPYAQYRQRIREQLLISRLQQEEIGPKIVISPQEITDALAHLPEDEDTAQAHYYIEDLLIPLPDHPSPQILDNTRKIALSLFQKAKKDGSSFQTMVEAAENAPLHLSGGNLGLRPLNELPDIFQAPLRFAKAGEIVGPIQAQNGFHLLRVLAIQGETPDSTPHYVTVIHSRHILIRTSPLLDDAQAEHRLREIRAEILRGGDFARLAQKYSQDPSSAFKGGDLGWTLANAFDPVFEAQANKLPLKQISLPFRTQFGWHIVEVLERTQRLQTRTALSREEATRLVYHKKFQKALKDWLYHLRQQTYIKIM